jgi:hypothetical protein
MEKALHKRIKIISISLMILMTLAAFIGIGITFESNNELSFNIFGTWTAIIIFPIISIITSYLIIHPEKIRIRKITRYALYISPVILIASGFGLFLLGNNTIPKIFIVIIMVIIIILALLQIFIISSAISITSTIIFLSFIIIGILFKRLHLPLAGAILTLSLMLFGLGCYMYGIRCLYLSEKNRFLKYVMFFGNLVVTISFVGLLFKMQAWPGGNFLISTSRFSIVIGTISVLLMLPSSGFIDWQPFHKKILQRLIFPWALVFLLFIIRFLLPEVDAFIWERGTNRKITHGFSMKDYTIENKNNLKSEQVTEP